MSFTVSTGIFPFLHSGLAVPRSRSGRGELEFDAEVAPGITVTWDPATPRQCVAVSVARTADTETTTSAGYSAVADRTPWLRLAAVTTFDHRLYLPLNRSLLDAEIASAQMAAARTLSRLEPVRDHLVDQALVRARRAARGVVHYLDRFVAAGRRPPAPLRTALEMLGESYTVLAEEVDDHDADLAAVAEAAHRLALVAPPSGRVDADVEVAAAEPAPSGVAQIDPRLLPARVLRLGPDVDAAEIDVVLVELRGRPAVQVRVPSFGPLPRSVDVPDVGVRLMDRRTGHVHGLGMLGLAFDEGHFEGTLSLPGSVSADDVRVQLHDGSLPPPVTSMHGAELRRARRATLFLAGWRGLFADARLRGPGARPAARLQAVVRTLAAETEGALWAGGPSLAHLSRIAELGDRKLAVLLRSAGLVAPAEIAGDDGAAAAVVNCVAGPGDLLAAEMAAAYDRVTSA
jgi:hypothetical protein